MGSVVGREAEQQSHESEQMAVGDWDWVGLQKELSQLDLGAEDPKVRAWVSLFLSCAAEENHIYNRDFMINLLRFIKFDSGGCRLEMLGPWLTASAGMHPRLFFTALNSDLDAQYDLALTHTKGMVKLGHALNFPVHFNVVLHWGALFSFASFSVDKALQLADTTMDDKVYDFTKPSERIKILELLGGMKQAIEAEAGLMQIPEVELFQSQRNLGSLYDFSEAKPSDKRTPAAMRFLNGLTMGKRYPRRDLQSARTRGWVSSDGEEAEDESEEAHVVEEDLLSIARQVPSDDARIMWRKWKESKWGKAGAAATAAEVSKLASDLTTLLSSDCNEEEVKEFGSNVGTWDHLKETKLGGLQGEALLTFRSLIAGLFCKVGEHHHRWDYVLHFLRWIGFSEGGCSLEHTRLGSVSFLSASAGAHVRMFVCLGEDLADEFMELLAVMHVRLLKPSTMKMMPFYVMSAGYAELRLRAFWVNQEEDRVVGWSTIFSGNGLLMDPEERGLLAAHLRAISRALVAEQLQLKMHKIVEPTEPRCVTLPQGVEVVTLAQPFDLLDKNCTRPYL